MDIETKDLVASGIFGWDGFERRTNRYGSFVISNESFGHVMSNVYYKDFTHLNSKRVHVFAKVIENRKSEHIGDMSLKLFPKMPNVGDIIDLGVGIFSYAPCKWDDAFIEFAISPEDGRAVFHIDPKLFYILHDQTVEIYMKETTEPFSEAVYYKEEKDIAIKNDDADSFQVKGDYKEGEKINIKPNEPVEIIPLSNGAFGITLRPLHAGEKAKITRS